MYKRNADIAELAAVPGIVPQPAANTASGRLVDLALAADVAKRVRTAEVAAINDAQCAAALQAEHDALTESGPLAAALQQLQQTANQQQQTLVQVQQTTALLQHDVAEIRNSVDPVRVSNLFMNSHADTPESFLLAISRISDNTVPVNFPATVGDFRTLNANPIDGLLAFYGLPHGPATGSAKERLYRLGAYLHIRVR
jgi:delta 1-pyrroline-5-carboxylate dehydrogenase